MIKYLGSISDFLAGIAQLAERVLGKNEVKSPILFPGSQNALHKLKYKG